MKLKSVILMFFSLTFFSVSYGQKVYNSNYKLNKESAKLALVPIYNERNSFIDTILTHVFNDTLSLVKTINPFEIREIITSNLKIKNLLDTIIVTDYKKKDL
jgi:cell division protein FtsI/penicillin-binding protein 2